MSPHTYHAAVHTPFHLFGDWLRDGTEMSAAHNGWEHFFTMHFLVNDIFMVVFFGIAAKEITKACLPNGTLNPVSKAINPLFATAGGVVGPIGMFLELNYSLVRRNGSMAGESPLPPTSHWPGWWLAVYSENLTLL